MNENNDQEQPLLTLIQEIKSGTTDPKILPRELRQQIVETLMLEGYVVSQIAPILKRSEKTIQRDINQIRAKNALNPSIDLARQMVGELVIKARTHSAYLMRLARSKGGKISDKAFAEYSAWKVKKELIGKLQTLGYLPLRPQQVVGDLSLHFDDQSLEKTFEDARKSLEEVIDVAGQCGNLTPELQKSVDQIHQRIEKAEIVQETEKVIKQSQEDENEK